MMADLHPIWVWAPFVAATVVLIFMLTVVPRKKRTFSRVALAGFAWMWSAWLMGGKYPSLQSWAWAPILAFMAGLLIWGLAQFHAATRKMKPAGAKK